jgi:hypothetical protein
MASVSRRAYLYGGFQGSPPDESLLGDLWVLDVPFRAAMSWRRVDSDSAGPRARHALIGGGTALLLIGGISSRQQTSAKSEVHSLELDSALHAWRSVTCSSNVAYANQVASSL